MNSDDFALIVPDLQHLPAYRAALESGWSPDNVNGAATARRQLDRIASDPEAFVASLDDREARGEPIHMPDGTTRPRLPGYFRWLWDGEFCGSISFRWRYGTSELPPHTLGHIGFAVVPGKRGRGYAAKAVLALLPDARSLGLTYLDITTTPDNIASQRTIVRAGGIFIEAFTKDAAYGGGEALLYRITL